MRLQIIYDQHTGRPKGFGFVKFEDQRDADDAAADANGKARAIFDYTNAAATIKVPACVLAKVND